MILLEINEYIVINKCNTYYIIDMNYNYRIKITLTLIDNN